MKSEFCTEFTEACAGEVDFRTYVDEDGGDAVSHVDAGIITLRSMRSKRESAQAKYFDVREEYSEGLPTLHRYCDLPSISLKGGVFRGVRVVHFDV